MYLFVTLASLLLDHQYLVNKSNEGAFYFLKCVQSLNL
jgi:hypothetical protein